MSRLVSKRLCLLHFINLATSEVEVDVGLLQSLKFDVNDENMWSITHDILDQLERENYLEKISEDCWRVNQAEREVIEHKYLDHLCEIGHHVSYAPCRIEEVC